MSLKTSRIRQVTLQFGRCCESWRRKGYLTHKKDGKRYIYRPTQPRHQAGRFALKQIFQTFFDKSIEKTVMTLVSDANLSDEELDRFKPAHRASEKKEDTPS